MASSLDNFKDLEELGIDCDSDDSLTNLFNEAANHLQTLLPNVDNQTLLTLYGYYKQGTEGKCNTSRPNWYDLKGKSKWDAWNKLENLPQHEAKRLYIEMIKKLDPDFSSSDAKDSKESWIRVSVPKFEDHQTESEKSLTDYIKDGDIEKVKEALKSIPDLEETLNTLDCEGMGIIHWAADRGSENILKLLLLSGANVNLKDTEGQSALHYAASCGHIDCVKLLIASGADLSIRDNDGLNAQSVACDESIKQLLSI